MNNSGSRFKASYQRLLADDDEFLEPPCFCVQQLVGFMFGWILSYIGALIFGSSLMVALFMAIGVSFGTLGGEHSNIQDIRMRELIALTSFSFLLSAPLLLTLNAIESHPALFLVAIIVSAFAAGLKLCWRIYNYINDDEEDTPNPVDV